MALVGSAVPLAGCESAGDLLPVGSGWPPARTFVDPGRRGTHHTKSVALLACARTRIPSASRGAGGVGVWRCVRRALARRGERAVPPQHPDSRVSAVNGGRVYAIVEAGPRYEPARRAENRRVLPECLAGSCFSWRFGGAIGLRSFLQIGLGPLMAAFW